MNGCTATSALGQLPSRYVTQSRQGPLVCDVEYSKYAPGYIDDPTGASDTNESGNEVTHWLLCICRPRHAHLLAGLTPPDSMRPTFVSTPPRGGRGGIPQTFQRATGCRSWLEDCFSNMRPLGKRPLLNFCIAESRSSWVHNGPLSWGKPRIWCLVSLQVNSDPCFAFVRGVCYKMLHLQRAIMSFRKTC